jgi:protein-L-isoaspartate(D-aspartate) O-methyltransferase
MWVLILLTSCTTESAYTLTPKPEELSTPPNEIIFTATPSEDEFSLLRQALVANTIEARGIENPDVIRAMLTVPRHKFVIDEYIDYAYRDHPLPIGYGQTISQPYIVALMTELLDLEKDAKVLEIGTGSGYQAAVLGELGYVEVYSIEIIPELAERAAKVLEETGYSNVIVKQGDGYYGWEEFSPYDAIIVTAAPDHLPIPLTNQLKNGGILVIPIGPPGGYQTLWRFQKEGEELKAYNHGGVSFVPFTGEGAETAP